MSLVATPNTPHRRRDPTLKDLAFDYNAIGWNIYRARKRLKKPRPDPHVMASAITHVTYTDTIEGSSTLEISMVDPDFKLIEYFDIDEDGRIDLIEINYPADSANWWRLHQLGASSDPNSGNTLTLTFIERPQALLLSKRGPKRTSRAKSTRAEFLRTLVKEVKKHPLEFQSVELHKRQPIIGVDVPDPGPFAITPFAADDDDDADAPQRNGNSTGGADGRKVTVAEGTKVKGRTANSKQVKYMNIVLDTCDTVSGITEKAALAAVTAAIGESDFTPQINSIGAGGIFQGSVRRTDMTNYFPGEATDPGSTTAEQCKAFLKGGKGFRAGGAIKYIKDHKSASIGEIVTEVEISDGSYGYYQGYVKEAEDIIKAYGGIVDGGGGGGTFYRRQFNFQIGDEENPKETYWDGMVRLARDVNWRLFISGRTVLFDSDMTLIKRAPSLVLARNNPALISWSANWDKRRIASEMQVEIICEPFDYRAGVVFKLTGFGPLSRGSSATNGRGKPMPLPGRWLVVESKRESGSYSTTFTLRQPERPMFEPNTEIESRDRDDDTSTTGGSLDEVTKSMGARHIIDTMVLPIGRKHGLVAGGGFGPLTKENVKKANDNHSWDTTNGNTSDHKGQPDSWHTYAADMMMPEGHPTRDGDKCLKELVRKFELNDIASYTATSGTEPNHPVNTTHKNIRFQIIYRTEGDSNGGDHYDHIHFGIQNHNDKPDDPAETNRPAPSPGPRPFGHDPSRG